MFIVHPQIFSILSLSFQYFFPLYCVRDSLRKIYIQVNPNFHDTKDCVGSNARWTPLISNANLPTLCRTLRLQTVRRDIYQRRWASISRAHPRLGRLIAGGLLKQEKREERSDFCVACSACFIVEDTRELISQVSSSDTATWLAASTSQRELHTSRLQQGWHIPNTFPRVNGFVA